MNGGEPNEGEAGCTTRPIVLYPTECILNKLLASTPGFYLFFVKGQKFTTERSFRFVLRSFFKLAAFNMFQMRFVFRQDACIQSFKIPLICEGRKKCTC